MRKILRILLFSCFLFLLSAPALSEALPVAGFSEASATWNCGMAYSLTVTANIPVAADTAVTIKCAELGESWTALIPAGAKQGWAEVSIPEGLSGKNLVFTLEEGDGYSASRSTHQLKLYSLPRVSFYNDYLFGLMGDGRQLAIRISCQNPASVLRENNIFELRNSQGRVLASRQWNDPSQPITFRVPIDEALLGRQTLSVYLNGACVTRDVCIAYTANVKDTPRLTTLNPSEPAISITIDCGSPNALSIKQTREILAVLDQYNVKATFFMTGVFVDEQTESALLIRDAGHEIGNHTYDHPNMPEEAYIQYARNNLLRCSRSIEEKLGVSPRLYRPPYGATNADITAMVRGEGMEEVMWTIDVHDWDENYMAYGNNRLIVERATNKKTLVSGSIILFHLDGYMCPDTLSQVIPYYQETMGFRCVTVSELMALSGRQLHDLPDGREPLVYQPSPAE